MENINQLTFVPFSSMTEFHREKVRESAISVYDSHASISGELLRDLGDVNRIEIGYLKEFDSFYVKPNDAGMPIDKRDNRNQFGGTCIMKNLRTYKPYDNKKYYARLTKPQKFGEYYLFSLSNVVFLPKKSAKKETL